MKSKRPLVGSFPTQWIVMGVSLAVVMLLGFFLFRAQAKARFLEDTDQLGIHLHSTAEADYRASRRPNSVAAVGLSIIADVLRDEDADSPDTAPRLTQVANALLTPVASVTPQPGDETIPASATPGTSSTPGPSPTGPTATPSLSPTITLSPTFGPSPTPTKSATPGPSPTGTKTATPGPSSTPTRTPTITRTATVGPSSTATVTQSQTATATHTPTNTSIPPTVTNTSLPPTPTNTVDVCSNISLSGFSTYANKADWALSNSSSTSIEISEIHIQWPAANGDLDFIRLDGANIWQQGAVPPSTTINSGWHTGSRVIGADSTSVLQFQFNTSSAGTGYTVRVTFTNSCQVQQSN